MDRISETNLEQLETEGAACIMYKHFGLGFWDGKLNPRIRRSHDRLAGRRPIGAACRPRRELERRCLLHKARFGNA